MKPMPECVKLHPEGLPDMSGEAVLSRLRLVGELNELCRFLGSSELASHAKQDVAAKGCAAEIEQQRDRFDESQSLFKKLDESGADRD